VSLSRTQLAAPLVSKLKADNIPATTGVARGEEGHNAPGGESLGGAEKSQQRRKYFLQNHYSRTTLL